MGDWEPPPPSVSREDRAGSPSPLAPRKYVNGDRVVLKDYPRAPVKGSTGRITSSVLRDGAWWYTVLIDKAEMNTSAAWEVNAQQTWLRPAK